MISTSSNKGLSYLLLAITSLIWGSSFILIKRGLSVFSPLEVGSLRIFLAFLAFLPVLVFHFKKLPKGLFAWLLLAGLVGSFVPSLLFSLAGSKLQSSVSGMLNATTPLFTVLVGSLFFQQRFALDKWIGLMIGLAGALVLGFVNATGSLSLNWYVLPVAFATLLYAFNVNLLKTRLGHVPPVVLSAATIVMVGPLAGALLFGYTDFHQKLTTIPEAWPAAGYVAILGLFGTALALVLFNKLIQISNPLTASSVTYMMPVISVLWGVVDGEPFHLIQLVGLGAILVGVWLVNRR